MLAPRAQWNRFSPSGTAEVPREVWLVLHLDPKKRGSLEQQLIALAGKLAEEGVRLTCVFARPAPPWLRHALDERRAEARVLAFERPAAAALKLAAWLQAARPQLVHFHFVRAFSPLIAAARLSGAKVVVNDHVTLTRSGAGKFHEALKRARTALLGPLVDQRVAVSRAVADSVATVEYVARAHVAVIENGIDVDRFGAASGKAARRELGARGRPLIVCVSRLSSEKGVESAIRALPLVGRGAILALVGDGPMLEPWRELAARLAIADRVLFLGVRDDVEEITAAADVVVVPSHWEEAFGLAVAEGMAAGRPVVVTESGAMPDLVGAAGLVVPKRDPGALAGAITRLLDDPLLAARLGRDARARARERFAMSRFVRETTDLYHRLCPALAPCPS